MAAVPKCNSPISTVRFTFARQAQNKWLWVGAQHAAPQLARPFKPGTMRFSLRVSANFSVSGLSLILVTYLSRSLHIHVFESQPSQQSRNRRTAVIRSRLQNPI